MSVQAIKEYIELCLEGDGTIPKRYEIILEQKTVVEAKLEEIMKSVKYINDKADYYKKLLNNEVPDISNP